jgi:outer membrane protein
MRTFGRIIPVVAAAATLSLAGHGALGQATAGRIAYVNVPQIMQSLPEAARADSVFTAYTRTLAAPLTRLQQVVDSSEQAYQTAAPMLSSSVRADRLKALQKLEDSVTSLRDTLQAEAQRRQNELLAPISDRVRGVVEGLRAEGNYDYVLDINAMGSAVVAENTSLDLTSKAIQRLHGTAGGTGGGSGGRD